MYGNERIWMNSACDWGVSVPLAVPKPALEMRRRGHSAELVDQVDLSKSAPFPEPVAEI